LSKNGEISSQETKETLLPSPHPSLHPERRSALAHVLLFTSMIPYPTLSHQKFINSPTLNLYLNLIQSLFAIILNKLKLEMPIHMVITFLKILPLYRFSPPSII
jgi:hypothetical protein